MSGTARRRGAARAVSVLASPETTLALAALVANIVAIFAYVAVTGTVVQSVRYTLYPVVWIVLSCYVVATLVRRGPTLSESKIGVAVAVGYFAVLAAIGTPFGFGGETNTVMIMQATPGWGPIVMYSVGPVGGTLLPFEVIGYATLSYAVGCAVAAGSRGALAGTVGLFTCVGCVLPVIGAVVGIFGGAASALQPATTSYGLATGLFATTVLLLLATIPLSPRH
ncbi:DUF7546 family protein [Halovenus halobia]|uniref:DUF7546 family protein n=1 Tax=Halovenus halobia TaxID=3396622 RepID=UPI003F560C5F